MNEVITLNNNPRQLGNSNSAIREVEEAVQRSDLWFKQRMGKFTASTIFEIMKKGRGKDTVAVSVDKFIMEKVAEKLTGERKQISGDALDWGTEHEPNAIDRYTKECGIKVEDIGFVPLKGYEDWAGGSPDGIIDDGKGIIEVKCPYGSVGHIETIMTGKIPAYWFSKYYAQMQMNMMCCDVEYCDFISYDPRLKQHPLEVIRIRRDPDFEKNLLEKLNLAIRRFKEMERRI